MTEHWVVQLETVNEEPNSVGFVRFEKILEDLSDCAPGLLQSPGRNALVLHVAATTPVDALTLAIERWNRVTGGLLAAEWRIVRVEVLTMGEFERECRAAEREEELVVRPDTGREGETVADRLLRDVFEDPLTRLPTAEAFRVHLQLVLNRLQDRNRRHAVLTLRLGPRSDSVLDEPDVDHLALLQATERIGGMVRTGDMVARLDHDTLGLLVKDIRDEHAEGLGARALRALTEGLEPEVPSPKPWTVVGIGIALGGSGSDADSVLTSALAALEEAARDGGGGCQVRRPDPERFAPPDSHLQLERFPDSADGPCP